MSVQALTWAFATTIRPATKKFVLVSLANHAGDVERLCWPCVKTICDHTSLNRKTVISCLDALEREGWIEDTGERRGSTHQVKVYRLQETQKRDSSKGPKNGTVEQSQKRNGSETGTVPLLPGKGPVLTPKGSQKRDTEPSLTIKEPNTPLPPKGGEAVKVAKKSATPEQEFQRDSFIGEFCLAYSEQFGEPYLGMSSDKAKATKLIQRATDKGLPVNGLVEMAKRAWAVKGDAAIHQSKKYWCSRLYNIGCLEAHYDEIRGEILDSKKQPAKPAVATYERIAPPE